MGWFDELEKEIKKAEEEDKKKQTKKEEVKDAEIVEKPAKEEVKEQPKEEAKPKKTTAKKESKSASKTETKKTAKKLPTKKEETFQYPFSLYTEGRTVDISNYGFENNKEYTPKEICDIMLKHRHYEFASEITFKMFEDDNTLVATSKQYKKG